MNTGHMGYSLGTDGFIWFVGVVESTTDPLHVGRAKVRIFGWHNADSTVLPTEDLPWAYPCNPISNSRAVADYQITDWVVGFFFDGMIGQMPMICWVLPSITQA